MVIADIDTRMCVLRCFAPAIAEALSRLRIFALDCHRVLTAEALEEAEAAKKSERT